MRNVTLILGLTAFLAGAGSVWAQDQKPDLISKALARNMLLQVEKENAELQRQIDEASAKGAPVAETTASDVEPTPQVVGVPFYQNGKAIVQVSFNSARLFVEPGAVFGDHWRVRLVGNRAIVERVAAMSRAERAHGR